MLLYKSLIQNNIFIWIMFDSDDQTWITGQC